MNSRNFFYNAALVFGLAVSGVSFADETVTVDPSRMTQQEREAYRTERQAGMTPEQRAEMQASQGGSAQGQGTMARDGSGSGGQYGRSGGQGGGQGGGMGGGRGRH